MITGPAHRTSRHVTAALLAGGLLAASCTSDNSVPDGLDVSYLEVRDDETWSSLAARVIRCDSGDPDAAMLDEVAEYLQDINPAIVDAGLADRQLVTFEPDRIPDGCGPATKPGNDSVDVEPQTETSAVADDVVAPAAGEPDAEGATVTGEATPTDFKIAFTEAFDDPAALDRFQWQLHHGVSFEQSTFEWNGDHDDACGKPTTTRTIDVSTDIVLFPDGMGDMGRYGDFVYWCAPGGDGTGHVMTSFDTEGYAQIAFAPNMPLTDVRKVCWDQNQTDLGSRKWTQLVLVPESTYESNDRRLDYVSPNFQDGPGEGGLRLTDSVFLFEMVQGSTVVHIGQNRVFEDFSGFTVDDKARRYSTCLTDVGDGTIQITLEREADTETRTLAGSFPSGAVRVVLQDDSYNPPKDPGTVPDPFTWHWDNITIETT